MLKKVYQVLIPITMHLSRSIGALILIFEEQKHSLWVSKKIYKWTYLAVYNLIQFPRDRT